MNLDPVLTALIGGNGSGKTAVFQALTRLFGVTGAERFIRRRDFHSPADQQELESGTSLVIDVILSFPELQDLDDDEVDEAVPEFFLQMAASAPGEPLKARLRLRAVWTDDGTPDGNVEEDLRWITTLGKDFKWDDCNRMQGVERGAIQLIYVPASRDAAAQVTALLKGRLWQAARWSTRFRERSACHARAIQKRFEKEEPTKFVIERLTKRWKEVHEADTDTTPVLRLVEARLEELVRRAEFAFYPDESGNERDLFDLSDGQRSLFHISLTAATLEVERDAFALSNEDSPFDGEKLHRVHLTLLAIEEPENSLSPFFLSRIVAQSRDIASLSSAQVVMSSHSPAILSRIDPHEVRFFRLDRQTRRSSIREVTLPEKDEEAARYVRLAVRAYPELYFARCVILGEGDSERIVIPRIAEAMEVHLDPSFAPIVPLAGRYVNHFWKLLTDLAIPHVTLLDFDLGRIHGGANTVRTVVTALAGIGNDLSENTNVMCGDIDPNDVKTLEHTDFTNDFAENHWIQALEEEGVFFSDPIDIDFAMLVAFPKAYEQPHPGGRGPRKSAEALEEQKRATLKSGGDAKLFEKDFDDAFKWYPYLFLSRSKPDTHLFALNRLNDDDLSKNAPRELKALINYVKAILGS